MPKYNLQRRNSLHSVRKLPHRSSALRKTVTLMIEKDD